MDTLLSDVPEFILSLIDGVKAPPDCPEGVGLFIMQFDDNVADPLFLVAWRTGDDNRRQLIAGKKSFREGKFVGNKEALGVLAVCVKHEEKEVVFESRLPGDHKELLRHLDTNPSVPFIVGNPTRTVLDPIRTSETKGDKK